MKILLSKAVCLGTIIDSYLTRGLIKRLYKLVAGKVFGLNFELIKYRTKVERKRTLSKINRKNKIPIFFIATHPSQWVADDLYKLLDQSEQFEPCVVIQSHQGVYDYKTQDLRNYYSQRGFQICEPRNVHKESKKQPIILIYFQYILSDRGSRRIEDCIDIHLVKNSIKLFLSYGIPVDENPGLLHARLFNAYTDYQFVFSKDVIEQAESYKSDLAENFLVTGYLGCDSLLNTSTKNNIRNPQDNQKIIWAPHHSINPRSEFPFSTFTIYSHSFLDYFKNNIDQFDLMFKPHPYLRSTLYDYPNWGKKKTDDYFHELNTRFRSSYGAYHDDFSWSDCIIMDSISFLAAYSTQCKPICFLMSPTNKLSNFSKLGKRFLKGAYIATNFGDIKWFLEDVIIGKSDPLLETRLNIFDEIFGPYQQLSSSKRSYDKIIDIVSCQH